MYLLFAVDVEEQLSKIIKRLEDGIKKYRVKENFTDLPYRLMLKVPCEVEDKILEPIEEYFISYFAKQKVMKINTVELAKNESEIFIKLVPSIDLKQMHDFLSNELNKRYHIEFNGLDTEFSFVIELAKDTEFIKINKLFEYLKEVELPTTIKLKHYFIAESETGYKGSYKIQNRVDLKDEDDRKPFIKTVKPTYTNY